MAGKITLITGGARSGKSAYAEQLAQADAGPEEARAYIATCVVYDQEMRERVDLHRSRREEKNWVTTEAPLELAAAIQKSSHRVLLVDCLTLWVTNRLLAGEERGVFPDENEIADLSEEVIQAARAHDGHSIFVTNEVGLGIVPENKLARRFRDLAGRCNQVFGRASNHAVMLVSGLPVTLK